MPISATSIGKLKARVSTQKRTFNATILSVAFGSSTDVDCNLKDAVQAAAIASLAVIHTFIMQADAVMKAASAKLLSSVLADPNNLGRL